MPHKITGLETRPVQVGNDRSVQRKGGEPGPDNPSRAQTGNGDGVHITGSAKQLAAIEQTLLGGPVIDEARVEKLRAAIDAGTYQVDAARVADKLLLLEDQLTTALPKD